MSDADRLREAADRLDETAVRCFNWPDLAREKTAAAALLRAVVEANPCWCQGKIGGYQYVDPVCAWHVVADPVVAAALALADTILGLDDGSSHE